MADLADKLARAIFTAPDRPSLGSDRVLRIQFKGGEQGRETDLGGFCESALAEHIRTTLSDLNVRVDREHNAGT